MKEKEHHAGLLAIQQAITLCEAVRAAMVEKDTAATLDKRDRSPVTVADFGAQALICHLIHQAFPTDPIVAEEDSRALQIPENAGLLALVTHFVSQQVGPVSAAQVCAWIDEGDGIPAERYWVLDPIDGTKGFLRNDQYAVALALLEAGVVQWGCLGCPRYPGADETGALFIATRHQGAYAYTLTGHQVGRLSVSATQSISQARLVESVEAAHTNRGLAQQMKQKLGMATPSVLMDSQAKYAAVAAGRAEIYLRSPNPKTPTYRENVWDHAAGALLVEEAGGKVTDVLGRPLDWMQGRRLQNNIGILVTNGHLHDEVLATLAECPALADLL